MIFSELLTQGILSKEFCTFTKLKKRQLKRIRNRETGMKSSTIYLNTLTESKNLILYTINLLKAQRDFVAYSTENGHTALEIPSVN